MGKVIFCSHALIALPARPATKLLLLLESLWRCCRLHGLIELFGLPERYLQVELQFIIALLLPLTFPAFFNLFIACYKSVYVILSTPRCGVRASTTYAPFVPIIAFPGIMRVPPAMFQLCCQVEQVLCHGLCTLLLLYCFWISSVVGISCVWPK